MSDVFTESFWNDFENDLWDELYEVVIIALMAGVAGGVKLLPANVRPLVDYDFVNRAVQEYAARYRYDLIRKITDTTRKNVQKTISSWVGSGTPLSALEAQLEMWFDPARAARIAATEVTRIFSHGNMDAWESTGLVSATVWQTSQDDRVCVSCEEMDGTHIGIGDIDAAPPLHVACRCFLQPELDMSLLEKRTDAILE